MNEACLAYINEVLKFRKALNLTSISQAEVFEQRFIRPSLAMAEWMPEQGRLLDIGSGMGIPGIPLLIAKPGLRGVLVERRKKRAEFLRHVVRTLALNAEVHDADINHLDSLCVDVCVARAVADQRWLLEVCTPHANPGALAVLPVPRGSAVVGVAGWAMCSEHSIALGAGQANSVGDEQLIRCYRFGNTLSEGFT